MPTNSAPHKFSIGQNVLLQERPQYFLPGGVHVITRVLPGDDFGRTYRARSAADGVERVFREPQLRADNSLGLG